MKLYQLAEGERKFAELIWQHEPVGSGELVRLAEESLHWKKSTTYTVLKKLCGRGLFQNRDAVVTSLVSREAFAQEKSKQFVAETFGGSLPKFLTAFMGGKKLSKAQAEELQALIDAYKEE
ncbi:BlaI/MecI/CopY family transcriptional regulator [Clostridium sp. D33t1_170424_F3]|uniref:BlaI/MecI/CopY family transcriptional regulator n=1 Tax=Clostridium sp. D33t1_170424_F3 TaxID=2787099 RepID=UPI0018AC8D52|nr:BlaI/MecI/CopY family transcriptional regulator [Clostridium sp. D33t1_170424_F3]